MKDQERADFEAFVAARYRQLTLLAYSLVGDFPEAEDLVQESLLKTWRAWRRIRHDDPVGYTRVVVARTYYSSRRRRWRGEQPRSVLPEGKVRAEQDRLGDAHLLLQALSLLPPRMRAVVVLRYREDMSERDVAAALGCSVGTVKSQASRGLALLRISLVESERNET